MPVKVVRDAETQRLLARAAALAPVRCWSTRRKAALLCALRDGVVTLAEACAAHGLTTEELAEWQRGFGARGLRGLAATKDGRAA